MTANSISVTNEKKVKKICGYLIDFETKQKINKATIHYIGTNNYSISNSEGFFELPYIENSTLEINYLGFEKLTLASNDLLSSSNCATFVLKPIQNELNEVVTTVFLTRVFQKK
ncbi:MAG: carboxypeptidase-like regulatory domain-containing protein [Flavobacterium sp.]|nr:carboxypeptidase-like regulatory domain-containing protein [Flavobacterium sp.]